MKRALKVIIVLVALVIVLVVAAVFLLLGNLNDIIEAAVEESGTTVTQAQVSLGEADVSIQNGSGALRNLVVGNPAGFDTDQAGSIGEISVKIDTGSLGQDPIVINEVLVLAPEVTYELGENGSNIDTIQRNVESYMSQFGGSESGGSSSEGPKIVIDRILVEDGKVNVSAAGLAGQSLSAPLPRVELTDVGRDSGGTTPEAVVAQITEALTSGIGSAVGTLNLDEVLSGAGTLVEGAAEGVTEGAGGAVEGIGEAVGEGAEGVGEAVKGLLGD
jgi:hypothetical protein